MPDVTVVIAYRDMGDPDRRDSFGYVCDWYSRFGWPIVVESGDDDTTFTRASGINAAVARVPDGHVVVQSDPDSLLADDDQLRHAVELAAYRDGLVIPHTRYLYLTRTATRRVYAGVHPSTMGPGDCNEHGRGGVGNVVVFSRRTWEAAGGFDERFGLWGGDDAAFAYACGALVGPQRRLDGDVIHLWHPRLADSRPGTYGYATQMAIVAEYRDAAAEGPDAVRRLVDSR